MNGTSLNTQGIFEAFPGMVLVPTGGKIFYVSNAGPSALDQLPPGMAGSSDGFFTTTPQALAACRSGRGDRILPLPGHTESVSAADYFSNLGSKTDVRIVGLGSGTNRATYTWTTATSSVLFDQANFGIENCRLFLAGPHVNGTALTVAAPLTFSAVGAEISDCDVYWGFDADQIVGIGITTTAAADNLKFNRNKCIAETAAVPTTTFIRFVGADDMEVNDTTIIGPGSTTAIGPVQFLTTASLRVGWNRTRVNNMLASSTAAVAGMAACTGSLSRVGLGIFSGTAPWSTLSGIHTDSCYYSVGGGAASVLF